MPISDGGLDVNGPQLQFNPSILDFGVLQVGNSATLQVIVKNIGDANCHITSIDLDDPQFTEDVGPPFTLPFGGQRIINVTFSPTGVGSYSAHLTITSDSVGNPDLLDLIGAGDIGGQLLLINPSSWDFGSQKDGVFTAEKIFVLTNVGVAPFNITALTYNGDFSAGPTQPSLPFTLNPGDSVDVGVVFTPSVTGFRQSTDGLVITSGADSSPDNVTLSGTGYAIIPAYVVSGAIVQTLAAFALGSVVAVDVFDPTQPSEEISFTQRLYEFGEAAIEETLVRVLIQYENLGVAQLQIFGQTTRQTLAPVTLDIGTVAADGELYTAFADLEISGDLIKIGIVRNSGPVSITRIIPRMIDRGEAVPK